MIRMRCGSCSKLIKFPDTLAGKTANCTACNAMIQVPTETDPLFETRLDNPVISREVPRDELIKFFCHFCGQRLGVAQSLAGEQFTCPDCNEVNNVPDISDHSGDEFEVVEPAGSGISWLFPVVMLGAILATGFLIYRLSGVFVEQPQLVERHSVGAKLLVSREESLLLTVTSAKGKVTRRWPATRFSAQVKVLGVDTAGGPTGLELSSVRCARGQARGEGDWHLGPESALAGKRLTLDASGALSVAGGDPDGLVGAHASGGWVYRHITGWLFKESALLSGMQQGRDTHTLTGEQARKLLSSAFFDGLERPQVACKLEQQSAGRWTLSLTLGAAVKLGKRRATLAGTGQAVYLPDLQMISELRLEATIKARDFEQPGDKLEGTWRVELTKKRQD